MGKKSKLQDLNPTTHMAKNPGTTTETPINRVHDSIVSKKSTNIKNTFVRRSRRLQSIIKPRVLNKTPDEIVILDNDNEEYEIPVEVNIEIPVEDNVNVEQVNALTKDIQADDSCESTAASLYKSLYFDSQKKNEALTLENNELRRNLEIALGKVEVYEALVRPISNGGPISSSGGKRASGQEK